MLLTQLPRTSKLVIIVGVSLTFLLALHILDRNALPLQLQKDPDNAGKSPSGKAWDGSPSGTSSSSASDPPCQTLPGAEDILVVMRTGASEIKDKLPIHESTTFKCYGPNLVIFSDYEETFGDHHVHNVLADMPQEIIDTHQDFKHYRHIQEVGRTGLDVSELSGNISAESGPIGKHDNAGWTLDKWKFNPMANRTLAMHPEKKWFVFVEPDTYLVWSNLLQWIQTLDPSKAVYYGSEVMIGDDLFAHGGSAFVLSKPALEKAVEQYLSNLDKYHELTSSHWAGDCVLGIVLNDAGVPLTWTWPMFQGGNPSDQINFEDKKSEKKKLWCSPALSYHHFTPDQVADMWRFEQDWIATSKDRKPSFWSSLAFWHDDHSSVLQHRDVFKGFVMPKLASERTDWTNMPETTHPGTETQTLAECHAICQANTTCFQYALGPSGCSTGRLPRIGHAEQGVQSGWMQQRIDRWAWKLDRCWGKDGWTVA